MLGDEFFCQVAFWWCIHERTGEVARIDINREPSVVFVNSSVAHFASALLAVWSWSIRRNQSTNLGRISVEQLEQELAELDQASMKARWNYWPIFTAFIRQEEPPVAGIEKGSRQEGEQALLTGVW